MSRFTIFARDILVQDMQPSQPQLTKPVIDVRAPNTSPLHPAVPAAPVADKTSVAPAQPSTPATPHALPVQKAPDANHSHPPTSGAAESSQQSPDSDNAEAAHLPARQPAPSTIPSGVITVTVCVMLVLSALAVMIYTQSNT